MTPEIVVPVPPAEIVPVVVPPVGLKKPHCHERHLVLDGVTGERSYGLPYDVPPPLHWKPGWIAISLTPPQSA